VQGLVWVDTYDSLGEPRTPDEIEELLRPFREDFITTTQSFVRRMFVPGSDPVLIKRVTNDMSAAPPEIAVDALRYAMTNDSVVLDRLREAHAPLVAINPDQRPTEIEALCRHGVKTVLMSGVGHFAMLEDPDGFNRLLREVVEGFVDRG
jgi:pimeloyl-ACP methyl ester carboxylesterase